MELQTPSGCSIFLAGGDEWKGVGIAVSHRLMQQTSDATFHAYSGRICVLQFVIANAKFSFISYYFLTSWDENGKIEIMYGLLQFVVGSARNTGSEIVVAGDFNMHALVACVLAKIPLAWENRGSSHEIPVVMLWFLGCWQMVSTCAADKLYYTPRVIHGHARGWCMVVGAGAENVCGASKPLSPFSSTQASKPPYGVSEHKRVG